MLKNHKEKEAIQEIFLIFSEFYKPPTVEFYEQLHSGEIDRLLEILFSQADYDLKLTSFKDYLTNFKKYKRNYNRTFIGTGRPFATPVESVYKVWSTNPALQSSPMARSKGYFNGDSAMHIRYLFEELNIEIPEEYKMMPDHLTLLLEFLAFLIGSDYEIYAKQFIQDHLDWLGDFFYKLQTLENSELYVVVTDLIRQVLSEEKRRLGSGL
ncbi:molecular chaperone TorD family protein [Bacillaceae bacterium S4-13-56]